MKDLEPESQRAGKCMIRLLLSLKRLGERHIDIPGLKHQRNPGAASDNRLSLIFRFRE